MKILISVANRMYDLDFSSLKDGDYFLDYYHNHELFPVLRSDTSITYIPKHAITAIHILE